MLNSIPGATITQVATGLYKCEVTTATKQDTIFLATTTDPTYPDFALLESERHFNILDALLDIPAQFWGYASRTLTTTLQQVSATLSTASISEIRGNTWSISLDLDADFTGKNVQFAIKNRHSDTDAESMLFVDSDTGLLVLNESATVVASDATITITDALNGIIEIAVEASVTSLLSEGRHKYGIQMVDSVSGDVTELVIGTVEIVADIVRTSS